MKWKQLNYERDAARERGAVWELIENVALIESQHLISRPEYRRNFIDDHLELEQRTSKSALSTHRACARYLNF